MVSLHTGDDTYLFLLCLSGSITENYRIVFHKQRRKKENSVGLKGGVAKLKEVGPRAWNSHLKSLQRSCCDHVQMPKPHSTYIQILYGKKVVPATFKVSRKKKTAT